MKYSIIVPAYNSASFINRCLTSVLTQTVKDYELIVVCDNCTDNTAEVVKPFAHKLLITNYGSDGPSRQAGIDAAEGERILFLDDDDWWLHEYVLDLIDKAMDDTIDVLCFGFIFKGYGYAPPVQKSHGRVTFWPAVWTKCYRRTFIQDTRFKYVEVSKTQAPDLDWTTRLMSKQLQYATLDQPLYYYNFMRKGSQSDRAYGSGSSKQILQQH